MLKSVLLSIVESPKSGDHLLRANLPVDPTPPAHHRTQGRCSKTMCAKISDGGASNSPPPPPSPATLNLGCSGEGAKSQPRDHRGTPSGCLLFLSCQVPSSGLASDPLGCLPPLLADFPTSHPAYLHPPLPLSDLPTGLRPSVAPRCELDTTPVSQPDVQGLQEQCPALPHLVPIL